MKHLQTTATSVSFDPSLYPRTYSVSRQNHWSWIAVGLVIAVGLPIQFWRSQALNSQSKVLFPSLFVLAGGYLILRALTLKLILEPDAVTVREVFSSHKLLRDEIAGWRAGSGGAGKTLVPRDDAEKAVAFPEMKTDDAYLAWFADIPELKAANDMDTAPNDSILTSFLTWVGIMAALLATALLFILLDHRPFEIQIVSLVVDTEFVFFLVFFDSRAWRGYSLRNKRVQRELPHLLGIHCFCLVVIFALLTLALCVKPRLPNSWVTENGPKDTSPFALALILIGGIAPTLQAWRYRKMLKRAVEEENTTAP